MHASEDIVDKDYRMNKILIINWAYSMSRTLTVKIQVVDPFWLSTMLSLVIQSIVAGAVGFSM